MLQKSTTASRMREHTGRIAGAACSLAAVCSLVGCAVVPAGGIDDALTSFERAPAAAAWAPALPPASRPSYRQGDVFVFGRATVRTVLRSEGRLWVWQTTDGETYKTTGDFFVPIVAQTPPGREITSRIEGSPEALWPLQVGRWVEFEERRTLRQNVFGVEQTVAQRWRCDVVDTRVTSVPAGDFETFHVRCAARSLRTKLPGQIITWDYAPALGHYVQRTWYEGGRVRQSVLSAALPGELVTPQRMKAILDRLQSN